MTIYSFILSYYIVSQNDKTFLRNVSINLVLNSIVEYSMLYKSGFIIWKYRACLILIFKYLQTNLNSLVNTPLLTEGEFKYVDIDINNNFDIFTNDLSFVLYTINNEFTRIIIMS